MAELMESIDKFMVSYNNLSDDEKKNFEAQIANITKNLDDRTKKLYAALIAGVKVGLSVENTVAEMERVDEEFKRNQILPQGS